MFSSTTIAEGSTWLYVETQTNYFVRQAVDISQPKGEGYVLLHGVSPGEKVVTAGAAHLLARFFRHHVDDAVHRFGG